MSKTTVHDVAAGGSPEGVFYLPVAPQITVMSRFAPMLPRRVPFMMPEEALTLLAAAMDRHPDRYWMAAVCGPGDPLAVPDTLFRTLDAVRARLPQLKIGLRTAGIGSPAFAVRLAGAGVDLVEMTVDGVRAEVLESIYAWVRPGLKTISLADGVKVLLEEQKNGVAALRYNGIHVTIVTTLYAGQNIRHVGQLSSVMRELGAEAIALRPHESAPGAEVVLPDVTADELEQATIAAASVLPVVDALLVGGSPGVEQGGATENSRPRPTDRRPNVAVVSSSGFEVDMHLGKADRFLIYGPREDGLACLLEARPAPEPGGGSERWTRCAELLSDCCALIAAHAGESPRAVLAEHGIPVILSSDQIEPLVDTFYDTRSKKKKKR